MKSGLYIHFPYCHYKCHYCDFNSYAVDKNSIDFKKYTDALIAELKRFNHPPLHFDSIFLGGGTPSLFPSEEIQRLLLFIKQTVFISDDCEITMEANPGTINLNQLKKFKEAGVNRLSVGIQSLHDAYLKSFGRIHSADEARFSLKEIEKAAFTSWNADLIFGFPNQNFKEWKKDLEEIVNYNMPHLSCYAFTVEPDAPYGRWVLANKAKAPDSDLQAKMLVYTQNYLAENGFECYEVSNFSKPKNQSRHNLHYWNYQPYLGLGAGAVSFIPINHPEFYGLRTTNTKNPDKYMQQVFDEKSIWYEEEKISLRTSFSEFMMMNLRLKNHDVSDNFYRLFKKNIQDIFGDVIQKHRNLGWMDSQACFLNEKGMMFLNQIIMDYMK